MKKTVLISGISGTIGAEIANDLSIDHAVTGISRESLREPTSVVAKFNHIHALIVAHGTYGAIGTVAETGADAWLEAIDANLIASYRLIRACLPKMAKNGSIVVMAGGGGGQLPLPYLSSYSASKAALLSLVRALSQEPGCPRINAISPGRVASRMNAGLVASGRAGPWTEEIRALMDHGKDATPIDNTVAIARYLVAESCPENGKVLSAKDWKIKRLSAVGGSR